MKISDISYQISGSGWVTREQEVRDVKEAEEVKELGRPVTSDRRPGNVA